MPTIDPNFDFKAYQQEKARKALSDRPQLTRRLVNSSAAPIADPWERADDAVLPYFGIDRTNAKQEQPTQINTDTTTAASKDNSGVTSLYEDLYAINHGENGLKKLDTQTEQEIEDLKKSLPTLWTDEQSQAYRRNVLKDKVNEARITYGGAPIHITNENLMTLALNKNVTADDMATTGILADIQRENTFNSFSRGNTLGEYSYKAKQNFFDGGDTFKNFDELKNFDEKLNAMYTRPDDGFGFMAGQLWDGLAGAPARVFGSNGGAALATAMIGVGGAVLAPFTGGASLAGAGVALGAGLAVTDFVDNYRTTKTEQAYNAMAMNPALSAHEAYDSLTNNYSALAQAGLLTATDYFTAKTGGKLAKSAKKIDEAVIRSGNAKAIAEARKKVYTDTLSEVGKQLGLSETVNGTISTATAATQAFTSNLIAGNQDLSKGVVDAALNGAEIGLATGALPAVAIPFKTMSAWRSINKARNSVVSKVDQKHMENQIHNTEAYKVDPEGTIETIEQLKGFNETKYHINTQELDEYLSKQGVSLADTPFADKVKQADANNDTDITFSLSEKEKLGKDWQQTFDDISKPEADGLSLQEAKPLVGDEGRKEVNKLIAEYGADELHADKEREATVKRVAGDTYRELRDAGFSSEKAGALVDQSLSFFGSLSSMLKRPMGELWEKYKPTFSKMEDTPEFGGKGAVRKNADFRGRYIPENRELSYAGGADMVTGVHEYSHYALDTLFDIGKKSREERLAGLNEGYPNLEKLLDDAFGNGWDKLQGKALEDAQEKFAYQMLDHIVSGDSEYSGTVLMRTMKRLIADGERQRYNAIAKQLGDEQKGLLPTDTKGRIADEYQNRFGYTLENRTDGFNALADALYRGEEFNRKLDEDYSPESIGRYFELNPEYAERIKQEHPELAQAIEEYKQRAQEARNERVDAIQQSLLKQTGRMFSFNDDFLKKLEKHTGSNKAVNAWTKDNPEIKKVFDKMRAAAKEAIEKSVIGAVYKEIKNGLIAKTSVLNDMVTLGMLTRSDVNKLKQYGVIADNKTLNPKHQAKNITDYEGKVDKSLTGGKQYSKSMKLEDIAQVLKLMLKYPEDQDLIDHIATEMVQRELHERSMLSLNDGAMRKKNIETRARLASDNAELLKKVTQGTKGKNPTAVAIERASDDELINLAADELVKDTVVNDLNERTAYRKASANHRNADKYAAAGEYDKAIKANRAERMALAVTKKITEARQHIISMVKHHYRLLRDDKKTAKTYDNDTLDLARYIGERWGLLNQGKREISLEVLEAKAKKNTVLAELLAKAKESGMIDDDGWYRTKTVDQLNKLDDLLTEIETAARNQKILKIGQKTLDADAQAQKIIWTLKGKRYFEDVKDANGNIIHFKNELMTDADGNIILKDEPNRGVENKDGSASLEASWLAQKKRKLRKGLGRLLNWCNKMDNGEAGVISETLYHVLADASAKAEQSTNKTVKAVNAAIKQVKWKEGRYVANELIDPLTGRPIRFGDGRGLNGSASFHIAGLLLHIGNEENYQKLIKGFGWNENQLNAFLSRAIKDGLITEESLNFVQKMWDMYDERFKLANEAYYAMHGRYMTPVKARELRVNINGKTIKLRGGYAPLIRDLERSHSQSTGIDFEHMKPEDIEAQLSLSPNNVSDPNWSKERTKATYPLELNPIRMLSMMPKVASYADLMPAIKQTWDFFRREDVRGALNSVDPHAFEDVVQYSIQRVLKRSAEKNGTEFGNKIISAVTNRIGMSIMCLNVANTITQSSGIVSAMTVVKPAYMIRGMSEGWGKYRERYSQIITESNLMRSRLEEANSSVVDNVNKIVASAKGETAKDKLSSLLQRSSDWQERHAYILQKTVQDRIDVAVYTGAFEQAQERILKEKAAMAKAGKEIDGDVNSLSDAERLKVIHAAEEAVIKTQSSSNMLDKSGIETSNAVSKMFFQFGNYFLTVMNYQVEAFQRAMRADATAATKAAFIASAVVTGVVIPSWIAEAIMKTARGDWWNDDMEGEDLLLDLIVTQPIKTAALSLPVVGSAFNTVLDSFVTGTNTTQQFINNPVLSTLNSDWIAVRRIFDGKFDGRTIRALGSLLGIAGNPFATYASKQVGNIYDVSQGNIKDSSLADELRMYGTTSVRRDLRKQDTN